MHAAEGAVGARSQRIQDRVDPSHGGAGSRGDRRIMSVVGRPLSRVDGRLKVTGQARYAGEAKPPGLVYAATVDATIPAGDDPQHRYYRRGACAGCSPGAHPSELGQAAVPARRGAPGGGPCCRRAAPRPRRRAREVRRTTRGAGGRRHPTAGRARCLARPRGVHARSCAAHALRGGARSADVRRGTEEGARAGDPAR